VPPDTSEEGRIAIASSKLKLTLMTLGAALFVAGGLWLFAVADAQSRYPPIYVKAVSVLAVGFFGLCMLYGVLKLFDRAPGLVLDREGIIDNSSGLAAGRVAWREIREVRVVSVKGQRFLALLVTDPQKYLGKGNALIRWFVEMNYRMHGTPILVSAHSLKVTLDDLEKRIEEFRRRHGNDEE
jgi:hypothetical protein